MRHVFAICVLTATIFAPVVVAQAPGDRIEAIATARHDRLLAFTVGGRVATLLVAPGDSVEAGQLLVELDDREEAARVAHLEERVASDAEARAAEARLRLAEIEEARARDALARDAAARFEVERYALETTLARIALELARARHAETRHDLDIARLRFDQRRLLAPVSGVVEEIRAEEGETVQPLAPVLRLVSVNELRVDVRVDAARTLDMFVGDEAWVWSSLEPDSPPVVGKIAHIGGVADPASDTRLVRVDAPNWPNAPAGVRVFVSFERPEGPDDPRSPSPFDHLLRSARPGNGVCHQGFALKSGSRP